jgi:hypothetical protein
MNLPKKWWPTLLAIWLVASGVLPLAKITFEGLPILLAVLGIIAGLALFLDQ